MTAKEYAESLVGKCAESLACLGDVDPLSSPIGYVYNTLTWLRGFMLGTCSTSCSYACQSTSLIHHPTVCTVTIVENRKT